MTPLGIFNDESLSVEVIFDKDIPETIGVHPLTNTKTIFLKTQDLINLIKKHGNKITLVSI